MGAITADSTKLLRVEGVREKIIGYTYNLDPTEDRPPRPAPEIPKESPRLPLIRESRANGEEWPKMVRGMIDVPPSAVRGNMRMATPVVVRKPYYSIDSQGRLLGWKSNAGWLYTQDSGYFSERHPCYTTTAEGDFVFVDEADRDQEVARSIVFMSVGPADEKGVSCIAVFRDRDNDETIVIPSPPMYFGVFGSWEPGVCCSFTYDPPSGWDETRFFHAKAWLFAIEQD